MDNQNVVHALKEVFSGAILLKRMAFAIFSGEVDQYVKYLPDIQGEPAQRDVRNVVVVVVVVRPQVRLFVVVVVVVVAEKLSEYLKVLRYPSICCEVLLTFRVLLLRL